MLYMFIKWLKWITMLKMKNNFLCINMKIFLFFAHSVEKQFSLCLRAQERNQIENHREIKCKKKKSTENQEKFFLSLVSGFNFLLLTVNYFINSIIQQCSRVERPLFNLIEIINQAGLCIPSFIIHCNRENSFSIKIFNWIK